METTYGTQPRDLIALAWYSIGFRPTHDLVLVGLHEGIAGPAPILRIPLPPRRLDAQLVEHVLRGLRRAGPAVDGVVALVMHDELASPRHGRLATLLQARAPAHGFWLADVVAVSPAGYRSVLCEAGCCPVEGRPVQEVTDSAVSVAMIAAGEVLAEDETELIADVLPECPGAGRGGHGRAAATPPSQAVPDGVRCDAAERAAVLARWRAGLASQDRAEPDPALARAMAAALADQDLRDAVLLCAVPGFAGTAERLLAGEAVDVAAAFATPPDPALTRRASEVLASVARACPDGTRAHPVAALAWLCWWSGHGTRARVLARYALRLEPGHRMAELVRAAAGVPAAPWEGGRRQAAS